MMKAARNPVSKPGAGLRSGVLVDPEWMAAHLHDPAVRVIEVDVSRLAYDEWHLDGAVLWNVYADLKYPDYQTACLRRSNAWSLDRGSGRTPRWCSTATHQPWASGS